MVEEIESLHVNDTSELFELPKGKKTIYCKWFLQRKKDIEMLLCITRQTGSQELCTKGGYRLHQGILTCCETLFHSYIIGTCSTI